MRPSNSPSANGSRSASPRMKLTRSPSSGEAASRARAPASICSLWSSPTTRASSAPRETEGHHPGAGRHVEDALSRLRIDRRDHRPAPTGILAEAQHGTHAVVMAWQSRRTGPARGACAGTAGFPKARPTVSQAYAVAPETLAAAAETTTWFAAPKRRLLLRSGIRRAGRSSLKVWEVTVQQGPAFRWMPRTGRIWLECVRDARRTA